MPISFPFPEASRWYSCMLDKTKFRYPQGPLNSRSPEPSRRQHDNSILHSSPLTEISKNHSNSLLEHSLPWVFSHHRFVHGEIAILYTTTTIRCIEPSAMFLNDCVQRRLSSLLRPWLREDPDLELQLGFLRSHGVAKNLSFDPSVLNRQLFDGSSRWSFTDVTVEQLSVRVSYWSSPNLVLEVRGVRVALSLG